MVSLLIKRYLWLVDLLRRHPEGLTLAEINNKWTRCSLFDDCKGSEISRRTFLNHCHAIGEQLGIDIECVRSGTNSYYKINAETSSADEQIDWMISTMATEEVVASCRDLKDKIILEAPDAGAKHLQLITSALRENTILNIEYQSFHIGSKKKTLDVEPLGLKMFKRRWYLMAQKHEDKAIRIYALDRILRCDSTNATFDYPKGFSMEKFFEPYYGICTDG